MKRNNDKEIEYINIKLTAEKVANIILEHIDCTDCGKHRAIQTGICPYCGKRDNELEKLSHQLISLLNQLKDKKMLINNGISLIEKLYFIKQYSNEVIPFKEIDDIIAMNNVEKQINDKIDEINSKIEEKQTLSFLDNTFISTYINHNINLINRLNYDEIIINIIQGNKIVENHTFEKIIIAYVKNLVSDINAIGQYYKKIDVKPAISFAENGSFSEFDDSTKIDISYESIKKLYEKQDISIFITIYHEIEHLLQYIAINFGVVSSNVIDYIKDKILRDELGETYYDENYNNISYEIDARIKGIENTIKFLTDELKFSVKKEYFEEMFQKEQKLRNQESMRRINNQNRTLDEIFEEVISKKPHLLDKYPQLKIRYILDNNFVRKKTEEELLATYSEYNNKPEVLEYIEKLLEKSKNGSVKKK